MMSSSEIETIVREVLSRMMSEQGSVPTAIVTAGPHTTSWTLHDAVISLDALRAVPTTTKVVHIPQRAIVTPAARDWCRERSIVLERHSSMLAEGREPSGEAVSIATTLTRPDGLRRTAWIGANAEGRQPIGSMLAVGREPSGDAARNATTLNATSDDNSIATPDGLRRTATTPDGLRRTATTPTRLFIAGTVDWLPGLARQLCPKQSHISERSPDDASAIRAIASALRAGHRSGIAIVQSPYSALWQSARDEMLRPAVVSQWSELNEIFREVPVNLLIIPATRWSVAGAANVARRFLDHLRSQS
ncbi:MAG: hypothetical protein MUF23_09840 [Pirellula sp.]|nr:hypothetical protein [Pirellula sp.]